MGENEIARIVSRLDNVEQRWTDKMEHHEDIIKVELTDFKKEITDVLKENANSNRWLMGILFGLAFSVIGFISISHFSLRHTVDDQGEDLGTVIGVMGQEHSEYYILRELSQKYIPQRTAIMKD